jgi:amino acid transporter
MADADSITRDDVEKAAYKNDKSSDETSPPGHDRDAQIRRGSVTPHHDGFFSAFTLNSFKRNPNARVVTEATDLEGRPLKDQPPAEPALAMKLKPRHLQMIAIGGSIGMSTFRVLAFTSLIKNSQALVSSSVRAPPWPLVVQHHSSLHMA